MCLSKHLRKAEIMHEQGYKFINNNFKYSTLNIYTTMHTGWETVGSTWTNYLPLRNGYMYQR